MSEGSYKAPRYNPDVEGQPGKLNIIFHGTFLFNMVTGRNNVKDHIKVLVPKARGHVFKIGGWMSEVEIAPFDPCHRPDNASNGCHPVEDPTPYVFVLRGVKEDLTFKDRPDMLPPDQNMNFRKLLRGGSDLERLLQARIRMPVPASIVSPGRTRVAKKHFKPNQADFPGGLPHDIATLQVFTYEFDDDSQLRLTGPHEGTDPGQFWEPSFAGFGEKRSVNLHIFAAPEHEQGVGHTDCGFKALTGLFQAGQVNLELSGLLPRSRLYEKELPPGVVEKETEDLAYRRRRLELLARMIKEDRDKNLLYYDSEALGPDPGACANGGNSGSGSG